MKRVYDTVTAQPLPAIWKRVRFYCCFAVFSAILFFANASAWAHIQVEGETTSLHTSLASEPGLVITSQHAIPHPHNTNLVFVETEVVDETETKGGNENGTLDHLAITIPVAGLHTGKSLLLQLELAQECLERISLFVLHHSWKSFLS